MKPWQLRNSILYFWLWASVLVKKSHCGIIVDIWTSTSSLGIKWLACSAIIIWYSLTSVWPPDSYQKLVNSCESKYASMEIILLWKEQLHIHWMVSLSTVALWDLPLGRQDIKIFSAISISYSVSYLWSQFQLYYNQIRLMLSSIEAMEVKFSTNDNCSSEVWAKHGTLWNISYMVQVLEVRLWVSKWLFVVFLNVHIHLS